MLGWRRWSGWWWKHQEPWPHIYLWINKKFPPILPNNHKLKQITTLLYIYIPHDSITQLSCPHNLHTNLITCPSVSCVSVLSVSIVSCSVCRWLFRGVLDRRSFVTILSYKKVNSSLVSFNVCVKNEDSGSSIEGTSLLQIGQIHRWRWGFTRPWNYSLDHEIYFYPSKAWITPSRHPRDHFWGFGEYFRGYLEVI